MEIVDLSDEFAATYLRCLEDWSDEIREAGDHKARWYERMRDRGLRVKLAIDDERRAVGMIQYVPVEQSIADGRDLYMVLCIWVHGYRRGVGKHQGHGIGSALLTAAEEDAGQLGAKGLAAWGITLPFWMRASWFKKHGYESADRAGIRELVWKRFTPDAEAPRWIAAGPTPEPVAGQVTMTAFSSGWCQAMNLVHERAKRVAGELGPPVVFVSIDTSEPAAMRHHGHSDEVFLDGKRLQRGAPPSYDKIKKRAWRRVRRLQRRRRGTPRGR
jgi:GNAT superfamily N-acetyltransferase